MVKKVIQGDYHPTSATVGVTGTAQGVGASGATVSLAPTYHVYKIAAEGTGEVDEGQLNNVFTSTPFNIDNAWYKYSTKLSTASSFTVRQGESGGTNATAYTLLDNLEPTEGQHIQVKVEVYSVNVSGELLAVDIVTCFALKDGSDTPHLTITNEAHVVGSANDGSGMNYSKAGGTLIPYLGADELTSDVTFYVGETGTLTAKTQNGLTLTLSGSSPTNKTYALSGLWGESDQEFFEIRCIFAASLFEDGEARTVQRGYSIAKSKTGTPGVGSQGDDAKVVDLTADDYSIVYDGEGDVLEPTGNITLTATAQNFTDPYFKFTVDGTAEGTYSNGTLGATSDQKTFTIPTTYAAFGDDSKAMRVGVAEAAADTVEIAFDTINIHRGRDGSDGLTVILSNDAVSLPANSDGSIKSYLYSGTTIEVIHGATTLDYVASATGNAGDYTVAPVESATGGTDDVVVGNATDTAGLGVTFDVVSAWRTGALVASIDFTIAGKNLLGTPFSVVKTQSFNITKEGPTGDNAKTIRVNPSQYFVRKFRVTNAMEFAPALITFTGATQNTTADGVWATSAGTIRGANGTGSVVNTHTAPTCGVLTASADFVDGMVVKYTLHEDDGELEDSYTLRLFEEGDDTVIAVVTNETHLLPSDADGVVSDFDKSGTQIIVSQGNDKLDYEAGSSAGAGEWNLATLAATNLAEGDVNFVEGAVTAEGSAPHNALIAKHVSSTAHSTDAFIIPLTITGRTAQNVAFTINKSQTLTKAKAGGTSAGIQRYVVAYRAEDKNPNPSVVPASNALLEPSGYDFDKPTITVNKRLYETQGTLNNAGDAYDWLAATSGSSSFVFTFRRATVPDGVNTYEVNKYDLWYDSDDGKKYEAQADNSDVISNTEWKEQTADTVIIDVDEDDLPNIILYHTGDMVIVNNELWIAIEF